NGRLKKVKLSSKLLPAGPAESMSQSWKPKTATTQPKRTASMARTSPFMTRDFGRKRFTSNFLSRLSIQGPPFYIIRGGESRFERKQPEPMAGCCHNRQVPRIDYFMTSRRTDVA